MLRMKQNNNLATLALTLKVFYRTLNLQLL
jgi:hypothetical protein